MQYVIPFSIMTTIYGKIFLYLRKHRIVREERPRDRQKARRTNIMLGTENNMSITTKLHIHDYM